MPAQPLNFCRSMRLFFAQRLRMPIDDGLRQRLELIISKSEVAQKFIVDDSLYADDELKELGDGVPLRLPFETMKTVVNAGRGGGMITKDYSLDPAPVE